jgi:hypothetical protein
VFEEWEREADLAAHLKAQPTRARRSAASAFAAHRSRNIGSNARSRFTTTTACRAPTSSPEGASSENLRDVGTADNNAGNPT